MASTPEQKKQWHQKYLKRREKALEQQKEYRLTNYQKYKEYQQRYREAHREELRERQRQYREEHQEYYKDYWHNRWIGEPLQNVNDYQRPPIKNKEEERQRKYIEFNEEKPESYVDDFFLELLISFAPFICCIVSVSGFGREFPVEINMNQVECFNTGVVGTIMVKFKDGNVEYVSRRRIGQVMKALKGGD